MVEIRAPWASFLQNFSCEFLHKALGMVSIYTHKIIHCQACAILALKCDKMA